MIHRIDPPIPLYTNKGSGVAHFLIDRGVENNWRWLVCLDENGEWWEFDNPNVRGTVNITEGREKVSEIEEPE